STSAMGVFTFTPSVPSATSNSLTTPSSTDSTSIVALSVSISASTSPDLTVSPTLTSHLASLPSSMVGDRAGMRIWGMSALQNGCAGHVGHAAKQICLGETGRQNPPIGHFVLHGSSARCIGTLAGCPAAQQQAGNHENKAGDDGALVDRHRFFPAQPSPRGNG